MSKIGDGLRTFANVEALNPIQISTLKHAADRIDSEMVELPQSADGKIWTGREVCFWTGATEGDRHEFNSLPYINGRWCVEDKHWQRYPAASVWYARPDSFECIADELDEQAGSLTKDGYTWQEDAIHDFADRIRKLAAKEDER